MGGEVRIARSFLEKDISEGGLKHTNVSLFNCALKLTWVKRLIQTKGDWQTIFGSNLIISTKNLVLNWTLSLSKMTKKYFEQFLERCYWCLDRLYPKEMERLFTSKTRKKLHKARSFRNTFKNG